MIKFTWASKKINGNLIFIERKIFFGDEIFYFNAQIQPFIWSIFGQNKKLIFLQNSMQNVKNNNGKWNPADRPPLLAIDRLYILVREGSWLTKPASPLCNVVLNIWSFTYEAATSRETHLNSPFVVMFITNGAFLVSSRNMIQLKPFWTVDNLHGPPPLTV